MCDFCLGNVRFAQECVCDSHLLREYLCACLRHVRQAQPCVCASHCSVNTCVHTSGTSRCAQPRVCVCVSFMCLRAYLCARVYLYRWTCLVCVACLLCERVHSVQAQHEHEIPLNSNMPSLTEAQTTKTSSYNIQAQGKVKAVTSRGTGTWCK